MFHKQLFVTKVQILGLLALVLFLPSVLSTTIIEVNRVGFGKGIDYMRQELFESNDTFANPGNADSGCTSRNAFCTATNCAQGNCCECQCNANKSFHSLKQGCVSLQDLYKTAKESPVGQGCNHVFYYTEKKIIPLFKSNTNALTVEGIRLGNFKTLPGTLLNVGNIDVKCVAGEVFQIDENGTTLIDSNKNNGLFEVQSSFTYIGVELVFVKNLLMTSRQYSDWSKLKGKLIRLNIECINSFARIKEASCILFKINGTSKVTSSIQTPSTVPKGTSTKATQSTTSTAAVPHATIAVLDSRKKPTSIGAIIGAVVGFVILLIIIILLVVWLKKRRNTKKKRPSSPTAQGILNDAKIDNGNDISYPGNGGAPLLCTNKVQTEDIEMQATMNPYYKTNQHGTVKQADKNTTNEMENLYYTPADLKNKSNSIEKQNMYYSSADAVESNPKDVNKLKDNIYNQPDNEKRNMALPGLTEDYSYARSDSPCSPSKLTGSPEKDNHYKALGNVNPEQDTYQSLTNPISGKKNTDSDSLEQVNPYYKQARIPDTGVTDNAEAMDTMDPNSKYLSLRNNAGSRENIAPQYQVPEIGNNEAVYQGLKASPQDAQYATLKSTNDEVYLDMSVGSPSEEYMYADPKEHKI